MLRRCPSCALVLRDAAFCEIDGTLLLEIREDGALADARIGTFIEGYQLAAIVGDGSMGRVYEAWDVDGDSRVALKLLHTHLMDDAIAVARFRREHEVGSQLKHPHIVEIFAYIETAEGTPGILMEYLDGAPLSEVFEREGILSFGATLRLGAQLALALEYAHNALVVHRDLKPENLFVLRDVHGEAHLKLLDFGAVKLALDLGPKLTAVGTTIGSPEYMSPEQACGEEDLDEGTDVFAMGVLLYEALAGKTPFEAEDAGRVLYRLIHESPDPLSWHREGIGAELDSLFARALSSDRTSRPKTPRALLDELARILGIDDRLESIAERSSAELDAIIRARAKMEKARVIDLSRSPAPTDELGLECGPSPILLIGLGLGGLAAALSAVVYFMTQ